MILALAVLTVLIWAFLLAGRGFFWVMREAVLPRALPAPPPRVAAVTPARNEAATIAAAAGSLLAQDYAGPFKVIVVDDHSTDGTAQQARMPGVSVVSARPLPSGWTGKVWAMSEGLTAAAAFEPDYVLFADADIVLPPDSLSTLVSQAQSGAYHLVSLMVKLRCHTFAEKLLIPAFVFFFLKLYPPAWVRDPRRRTAGAAGGCLLVRAATLTKIGGMAAIRGEVIDDCALARAVKRAGGGVWLGLAGEQRSLREYPTLADAGRMISRTAFTQLRYSTPRLLGAVAGMALTYLAPPLLLAAGGVPAALGALAWALMTAAYIPALRLYRLSPLWALALPLAALFYTGATVSSALRYWRGRGGSWKGRFQAPGRDGN